MSLKNYPMHLIAPHDACSFFSEQDAYTAEDIIYKWEFKDVEVGATQMAQFDYKRASLSTSVDMYKIGKSYIFDSYYCRRLTILRIVRVSMKECSLGVGFCDLVV